MPCSLEQMSEQDFIVWQSTGGPAFSHSLGLRLEHASNWLVSLLAVGLQPFLLSAAGQQVYCKDSLLKIGSNNMLLLCKHIARYTYIDHGQHLGLQAIIVSSSSHN